MEGPMDSGVVANMLAPRMTGSSMIRERFLTVIAAGSLDNWSMDSYGRCPGETNTCNT